MTHLRNLLTAWALCLPVPLCLWGAAEMHAQAPGRFAGTYDGNYHDRDDIGAVAVASSLIVDENVDRANRGQAPLRYVGTWINDHIPQSSSSWERDMRESVRPYGLPVFDCRPDYQGAARALRTEMAKSNPTDPLHIAMCGPCDLIYEAAKGVSAAALQNVTVVSHSSRYNETTEGGTRNWWEIPHVKRVSIANGNTRLNTKQNWSPWNCLRTKDSFAYQRLRAVGRADASDATVTFYLLYGKQNCSISDICGRLN